MEYRPAERIAAEVRAEMGRQRVTQKRLAEALHLSQQALSRRMTGEIPLDVDEIQQIADFLNVPLSQLFPGVAA